MNKQTIEEWTKSVEKISTGFEQINTELKRKYIIWNTFTALWYSNRNLYECAYE